MVTILIFRVFLSGGAAALVPVSWPELALSITRAPDLSSDTATICRVRVVNNGRTSWPGRRLAFEARALRDGLVLDRQRGCFGGTLAPHDTLETVVAFTGIYERFEVSPVEKLHSDCGGASRGARQRRGGRRRR